MGGSPFVHPTAQKVRRLAAEPRVRNMINHPDAPTLETLELPRPSSSSTFVWSDERLTIIGFPPATWVVESEDYRPVEFARFGDSYEVFEDGVTTRRKHSDWRDLLRVELSTR